MGTIYIPPPAATKELNLNDEWRGRWVDDEELPDEAPVIYAYSLVYMGERGYATRPANVEKWGMVELPVQGDDPEEEVKRAVKEQTGGTVSKLVVTGYLECVATSHHSTLEAGSVALRPLYVAVLNDIEDLGREAPYQRRRLPLNEYVAAMRTRYPEIRPQVSAAASRYVAMRAKGEA
jgi:hypothetical protein